MCVFKFVPNFLSLIYLLPLFSLSSSFHFISFSLSFDPSVNVSMCGLAPFFSSHLPTYSLLVLLFPCSYIFLYLIEWRCIFTYPYSTLGLIDHKGAARVVALGDQSLKGRLEAFGALQLGIGVWTAGLLQRVTSAPPRCPPALFHLGKDGVEVLLRCLDAVGTPSSTDCKLLLCYAWWYMKSARHDGSRWYIHIFI